MKPGKVVVVIVAVVIAGAVEVASQLVANDKNIKAIEVYEFNFELYPQKLF
jgi:hypothetical protein